jgi:hypothetical protein
MARKHSEYVRCRYCDWKTVRFYTNKHGKVKQTGLSRLEWHMYDKHPDEHFEFQEKSNISDFDEYFDERNETCIY